MSERPSKILDENFKSGVEKTETGPANKQYGAKFADPCVDKKSDAQNMASRTNLQQQERIERHRDTERHTTTCEVFKRW
jgi:hypothetical protein